MSWSDGLSRLLAAWLQRHGLPHPGVADIATTGNNDAFLQRVYTDLRGGPPGWSYWVADLAASCGAANPSPPQVSTGLVLNEQNTKISALHSMLKLPLAAAA